MSEVADLKTSLSDHIFNTTGAYFGLMWAKIIPVMFEMIFS